MQLLAQQGVDSGGLLAYVGLSTTYLHCTGYTKVLHMEGPPSITANRGISTTYLHYTGDTAKLH